MQYIILPCDGAGISVSFSILGFSSNLFRPLSPSRHVNTKIGKLHYIYRLTSESTYVVLID